MLDMMAAAAAAASSSCLTMMMMLLLTMFVDDDDKELFFSLLREREKEERERERSEERPLAPAARFTHSQRPGTAHLIATFLLLLTTAELKILPPHQIFQGLKSPSLLFAQFFSRRSSRPISIYV